MKFELRLRGKSLAAAAVVCLLATLAMAAAIAKGTGAGRVNADAIAQTVDAEQDHVTPGELARWILEGKRDYQLVDIRPQWQYDDYHIPTAINIPFTSLFQETGLKQLSRDRKIVLYGYGAGHAAQGELLLAIKGFRAYSVRDGIVGWWEAIMTPSSIVTDPPNRSGYVDAKRLRQHFLGIAVSTASAAPKAP